MQSEPQAGFPDIDRFSFLMLRLVSRREQLEGRPDALESVSRTWDRDREGRQPLAVSVFVCCLDLRQDNGAWHESRMINSVGNSILWGLASGLFRKSNSIWAATCPICSRGWRTVVNAG